MKTCIRCKTAQPKTAFSKSKTSNWCKECSNLWNRERYKKDKATGICMIAKCKTKTNGKLYCKKHKTVMPDHRKVSTKNLSEFAHLLPDSRTCNKCNTTKTKEYFYIKSSMSRGGIPSLYASCKSCTNETRKHKMDKYFDENVMRTCSRCDEEKPQDQIAGNGYCKKCAAAYLKSRRNRKKKSGICTQCPEKATIGFLCKKCSIENRRRINTNCRRNKARAVELMGGKCKDCGFQTEHLSVYDFHHLEPKGKDFSIGLIQNHKWENIERELKKCVMLCSNCHRIRHHEKVELKEKQLEKEY